VQRAFWAAAVTIFAAGVAGVFGKGPLAEASAGDPGGRVRIEYERFARHESSSRLEVLVGGGAWRGRELLVWIGREYLDGIDVDSIVPRPKRAEIGADRVAYVFDASDPSAPASVSFRFRPWKSGAHKGRAGVGGGPSFEFHQFVFP
jgi:hypothetical protein